MSYEQAGVEVPQGAQPRPWGKAVLASDGTPEEAGAELGVPARTVSRVLVRHHVPPLCALDPLTGKQIRTSKATAVRYERGRPGELVHRDVNKIGRVPDGGGWRACGRASASIRRDRDTKVGFDYAQLPSR